MSSQRNREEVINTQFAVLLSKHGTSAEAETILAKGKHRPDILLQMRGIRVVIEAKFDDHAKAEDIVLSDARNRVRSGIAHIAVAVIYSSNLRSASTSTVIKELENAKLRFRIVSEAEENESWFEGTPSNILAAIRRAQEALAKDDIVERTAKKLSTQLETIAKLWIGQTGTCDRLSEILGIHPPAGESLEKATERRESATKVSALVLANAFIFQEQLSVSNTQVKTLKRIRKDNDIVNSASKHWNWIWKNVDYVPIFQLGEKVLNELPSGMDSTFAVEALLNEAQDICRHQAALRHDLMGRIYHWLLHEAKYLGTYYTSTTAATLLLKLVFALEWNHDFSKADSIANFKIGDFACGTGTLLMAGAQAITDRYVRERAERGYDIGDADMALLHQTLMQNVMHGYDILPTAVHLTASTLALLAPEVAFNRMNLFVMPIGIDHDKPRLGSLDFIESEEVKTQFALDDTQLESVRSSVTSTDVSNAWVPKLDLCVMNPPFVRSTGSNLLFGSLPKERKTLQTALSDQAKSLSVNTTAGLGAMFVPLAKRHTKTGGRIAFILPVALATGEAWGPIRELIANNFHLELVVTSHDIERFNFSENTSLSEILIIAKLLANGKKPEEKSYTTNFIKLWRNPRTIHEALDCASRMANAIKNENMQRDDSKVIRGLEDQIIGEIACMPTPVGKDIWSAAIIAQNHLTNVHWGLFHRHKIRIPSTNLNSDIKLCRLDELGEIGHNSRDIMDAFEVDLTSKEWSPYAGFWNHDSRIVKTIKQKPNSTLMQRTEPKKNRKIIQADHIWAKSAKTLFVAKIRTNTHRLIATSFENNVLGNTWLTFREADITDRERKALILWLNSAFGILSLYGQRVVTEGAWTSIRKPAWSSMQVLDVRELSDVQLEQLESTFEAIANESLKPVAELNVDPVRIKIDEDICRVLNIPNIDSVRQLLAREPSLSAKKISALYP